MYGDDLWPCTSLCVDFVTTVCEGTLKVSTFSVLEKAKLLCSGTANVEAVIQ